MDVASTGGWQKWATQKCSIQQTKGVHDLYFVFKGGDGYLYNLNWWRLNMPEKKALYGDMDGSGKLDVYDLILLKKAAASGNVDDLETADLDGNGRADIKDVQILNDFLLGRIKTFPVCA